MKTVIRIFLLEAGMLSIIEVYSFSYEMFNFRIETYESSAIFGLQI